MASPKILLLDIETAPHRVFAWGLYAQDIHLDQIEKPGFTLCFGAKWYGAKRTMFHSVEEGSEVMVQRAYELLDTADIVIHYNGTKFDIPLLNQEFLAQGLPPPSPYQQIDLYRVVRRRFRQASNKLDFVSQQLGLGAKVRHKGMELWRQCMEGDKRAWAEMKRYNVQDVKLLEPLYERLLPWINNHPNVGKGCPSCGKHTLQRRGYQRSKTLAYARFQCQSCGSWSREPASDREQAKPQYVSL